MKILHTNVVLVLLWLNINTILVPSSMHRLQEYVSFYIPKTQRVLT